MLSPINPSFTANPYSPKLRFKRDDFFVNIPGYGKNKPWADEIIKTADSAVDLIRKNSCAENILKSITNGVKTANLLDTSLFKRNNTGILRTKRDGWEGRYTEVFTQYISSKYKSYSERLNTICTSPLEENPLNIGISRPVYYTEIYHGEPSMINYALDKIFDISKNIFPKFIKKDAKQKDLNDINNNMAEIRWILAHATPWIRGSDAISNVFMRAVYKAIGIKTYPLTQGISLDLEAYCTELSDYKKNFTKYFTKPPEIIE